MDNQALTHSSQYLLLLHLGELSTIFLKLHACARAIGYACYAMLWCGTGMLWHIW